MILQRIHSMAWQTLGCGRGSEDSFWHSKTCAQWPAQAGCANDSYFKNDPLTWSSISDIHQKNVISRLHILVHNNSYVITNSPLYVNIIVLFSVSEYSILNILRKNFLSVFCIKKYKGYSPFRCLKVNLFC
jgi:hypothetical protein